MPIIEFNRMESDDTIDPLLEHMRKKLNPLVGVQLQGNHLTLQWANRDRLIQVHCVILAIDDGVEGEEEEDLAPHVELSDGPQASETLMQSLLALDQSDAAPKGLKEVVRKIKKQAESPEKK